MFLEVKPDGRIRHLVVFCFRNDNTPADHSNIPNQQTILQALAKRTYCSKKALSDAYFLTRVHLDDVKYNIIRTQFGGSTSQVMMQGDINSPATFIRVMGDLFHDELGKFILVYIDDMFIFSDSFEQHIEHHKHACRKLKEHKFYANPKKSVFIVAKLDILAR